MKNNNKEDQVLVSGSGDDLQETYMYIPCISCGRGCERDAYIVLYNPHRGEENNCF